MNNNSSHSSFAVDRREHAAMLKLSHFCIAAILTVAACKAASQAYRERGENPVKSGIEIVRR